VRLRTPLAHRPQTCAERVDHRDRHAIFRHTLDPVAWYGVYNRSMKTIRPASDEHPAPSLTIGRLARAAGVGVETVRFYERQGLLAEPARRSSGYRHYGEAAVARLQFIRRAKDLGFTLSEIKSLLELRRDPTSTAADVRRQARQKIEEIDQKLSSLQQIRAALMRLVNECHGHGPLNECPIVDAMEHGAGTKATARGKKS
jgi:MerR family transcriptional regulator, copper efflux regulator